MMNLKKLIGEPPCALTQIERAESLKISPELRERIVFLTSKYAPLAEVPGDRRFSMDL